MLGQVNRWENGHSQLDMQTRKKTGVRGRARCVAWMLPTANICTVQALWCSSLSLFCGKYRETNQVPLNAERPVYAISFVNVDLLHLQGLFKGYVRCERAAVPGRWGLCHRYMVLKSRHQPGSWQRPGSFPLALPQISLGFGGKAYLLPMPSFLMERGMRMFSYKPF